MTMDVFLLETLGDRSSCKLKYFATKIYNNAIIKSI